MSHSPIPDTPRVISPSPTLSEASGKDGYFPPTTRSKKQRLSAVDPIQEGGSGHEENDPELSRARSRSRSPNLELKKLNMTANRAVSSGKATDPVVTATKLKPRKAEEMKLSNRALIGKAGEKENGLLSPRSALTQGFGVAYWRSLSRSPSPLGLIPIHREWRAFVHKHEVPRKVLHVSIGLITLCLYYQGVQASQTHPILLGLLIPILSADMIRFKWSTFNRIYIRYLGAFMRESEAHDRFNGVIGYLAGLWATMYFCRKDVAVMSVLLLSWCDTAASTFGRLWGKYTPRLRRGKSLAGSIAAFTFGVGSAVLFWGIIAPVTPPELNSGVNSFAFEGQLTLPLLLREYSGLSKAQATISGRAAQGVLALFSGLIASASEAIDIFGLDDNLTIPILSGIGLEAFLWACS